MQSEYEEIEHGRQRDEAKGASSEVFEHRDLK